jgi:hypothetical protein
VAGRHIHDDEDDSGPLFGRSTDVGETIWFIDVVDTVEQQLFFWIINGGKAGYALRRYCPVPVPHPTFDIVMTQKPPMAARPLTRASHPE